MSIVMPPGGWPPPRRELYGEAKWVSTSVAMLFSRGDTPEECEANAWIRWSGHSGQSRTEYNHAQAARRFVSDEADEDCFCEMENDGGPCSVCRARAVFDNAQIDDGTRSHSSTCPQREGGECTCPALDTNYPREAPSADELFDGLVRLMRNGWRLEMDCGPYAQMVQDAYLPNERNHPVRASDLGMAEYAGPDGYEAKALRVAKHAILAALTEPAEQGEDREPPEARRDARVLQLEDACMYAFHTLRACEQEHGRGKVPGEHSVLLDELLREALIDLPPERWGKHEGFEAVFERMNSRMTDRSQGVAALQFIRDNAKTIYACHHWLDSNEPKTDGDDDE